MISPVSTRESVHMPALLQSVGRPQPSLEDPVQRIVDLINDYVGMRFRKTFIALLKEYSPNMAAPQVVMMVMDYVGSNNQKVVLEVLKLTAAEDGLDIGDVLAQVDNIIHNPPNIKLVF